MTAPDSELGSEHGPETPAEPGEEGAWEGDVENQASSRRVGWKNRGPETEEK
jgi:hypothetical protein